MEYVWKKKEDEEFKEVKAGRYRCSAQYCIACEVIIHDGREDGLKRILPSCGHADKMGYSWELVTLE